LPRPFDHPTLPDRPLVDLGCGDGLDGSSGGAVEFRDDPERMDGETPTQFAEP
jgi:hypothetical protein